MATNQNPQLLGDVSEGILQGVANNIAPENSVYFASNLVFDNKMGSAVVRKGIEKLGDKKSDCNGLHHFIKTDGSEKLLGAFGTNIYSLETGTWTSRTTIANTNVRFLTFIDTVLALDGTNKKTSTDGESWVTTGGNLDVDNMPLGKYALNWKDKLYISGVSGNPDRLYFSSLYGVPTTGQISWTDDTAGYIDVDPEDGAGSIVGLAKVPGYFLIFKKRSLHRWDGRALQPESLINVGTQSQESMALGRETLFFWNERGVYETNGGYPRNLSRRIQHIVDAVSSDYQVSAWSDSVNVYFSIGNIELDDVSLSNCVVVYNIDNQVWTLFSYPSNMVVLQKYIDGKEKVIAGDGDGQVWILNEGYNDDGNLIYYHLQYQNIDFNMRAWYKDISEFVVYSKHLRGATLYARTEDGDFNPMGGVNNNIGIINNSIKGRYFDFRISGVSNSDAEIGGLLLDGISLTLSKDI